MQHNLWEICQSRINLHKWSWLTSITCHPNRPYDLSYNLTAELILVLDLF